MCAISGLLLLTPELSCHMVIIQAREMALSPCEGTLSADLIFDGRIQPVTDSTLGYA
jgi:hypothetical protein